MVTYSTACLGFGRMGPNRELKFALEKYWKGTITAKELLTVANSVEDQAWALQTEAGINKITVGDYCLYDNVLQFSEWLGITPSRFGAVKPGLDRMFAMARGVDGAPALSMKKWLTSNYHYMVPEVDESLQTSLPSDFSEYITKVQRGIDKLGANVATPVILGPVSMVRFCNFKVEAAIDLQRFSLLQQLLPIYTKLLAQLASMGVTEIQIHEPALAFADASLKTLYDKAYPSILPSSSELAINMVSFFEDVGETNYQWLTNLSNVKIVSLDFTRGDNLSLIKKYGFPKTKILGAGVIDGRSVWKANPANIEPLLKELGKAAKIRIQPSSSLQFVPWDLETESNLISHTAGSVLAFSKQKLSELSSIAKGDASFMTRAKVDWATYKKALSSDQRVSKRLAALTEADFCRSESYAVRRPKQTLGLPILPTTSIGSFPQTKEIRSIRNQFKRNKITKDAYENAIDQQLALMIGIQEGLGLDIFVHGEPERTDMVEFFAQKMDGMLFSQNGWVQSFGSRCVRPPIFWNDISRPNAMTVREFTVSQKLASKPVKGMLTGPVTILNWSFPRVDISRKVQAMQIGLAVRDEILDLERAGCKVIQVDEPALREAMPLKVGSERDDYLTWTVDSFRLATAGVQSKTQIHTHMCYCEFSDCMEAIDKLDTDVNSIENARSDNATLLAFRDIGYGKGLGPGTYDIHSPVVPPVAFIEEKLRSFLKCMDVNELVVNPDCGLKTRAWPETIAALKNMVEATKNVRKEILAASA